MLETHLGDGGVICAHSLITVAPAIGHMSLPTLVSIGILDALWGDKGLNIFEEEC